MGKFESTRTYLLQFPEEDFAGLEIRARGLSIAGLLNMTMWADQIDGNDPTKNLPAVEKLFRTFADVLLEWNVTNLGVDVPPTYEGVMAQDLQFMMSVVMRYIESIASVPDPLAQKYSDTAQSEGLSIPMEPLSESPGN